MIPGTSHPGFASNKAPTVPPLTHSKTAKYETR
jgi:hypothetical protein